MNDAAAWAKAILDEMRARLAEPHCRPRATYRLQFHTKHFTFRDAAAVVPYLGRLGVSHVYVSPCLKAHSRSEHGYAVVDYGELNPKLGTPEDFDALVTALRERGMGVILDLVPNHMSVVPGENRWWTDVLENGPASPYADHFDIEWQPVKEELKNKILFPMLGRQFGEVLEAGELRLNYHRGALSVNYFDMALPLDPRTYHVVLSHGLDDLKAGLPADSEDLRELESIMTAIQHLPERTETAPDKVGERQREKEVIKDRLRRLTERCGEVAAMVERNLGHFNGTPGLPASFDPIERLLDAQAYRLSHWKAAADEINYRRFFDVNELAAVCMEQRRVFEACHAFVFELLAAGKVDGLRIDHVDGLYDPLEYLWRVQWGGLRAMGRQAYEARRRAPSDPSDGLPGRDAADRAPPEWADVEAAMLRMLWSEIGGPSPFELFGLEERPALLNDEPAGYRGRTDGGSIFRAGGRSPIYVVAEKILGPEEPLPPDWPAAGTTGYDFLNCVNGLFVDAAGLTEMVKAYRRFTRAQTDSSDVPYRSKLLILRVAMASELYLLTHRLNRISERHRLSRDFTLNTLRTALREILACFPVYRTYIGSRGPGDRDRDVIRRAVADARRRNPAMDLAVFDFIQGVLLLERPPELDEEGRRERDFFVGRFQQVTSPVMAKGVEDTAFSRHCPLASVNEVGGEPTRAAVSVDQFHEENLWRRAKQPFSMTATTTHDTKRSEDVRSRIDVLSQVPQVWRSAVTRWARLNRRHHRDVEGKPAPDRNDEWLFYQTLAGIWPLDPPDHDEHERLVDRMTQYMEKATREAKAHTSWISPDAGYDQAVRAFVRDVLRNDPKNRFLRDFQEFVARIADWGFYTALSQTFLKLVCPGTPDIYQGQELWDFSLVDPDNRRPVDFARREKLLAELEAAASDDQAMPAMARGLAASPRDPRLKLFVTWRSLQFRRSHAELFSAGRYVPIVVQGTRAKNVCAFAWQSGSSESVPTSDADNVVIAVAPRLVAQLLSPGNFEGPSAPPETVWLDTVLDLPPFALGKFKDAFTEQTRQFDRPYAGLADLLADFPLALLEKTHF